jgi:hypothetical protein
LEHGSDRIRDDDRLPVAAMEIPLDSARQAFRFPEAAPGRSIKKQGLGVRSMRMEGGVNHRDIVTRDGIGRRA